jgi:diguanylate cyclase (GGDEF)-like protein/PAS domain S-box-containing protein
VTTTRRNLLDGLGAGDIALTVLRTLPGASTLVFDRDLRYVLAGGAALDHEGLTASEIEGMPAEEVLVGERWGTYEPLYRSALNGETRSLEVWSPDDTRCCAVEVGPLRGEGGEIVGGVAVARDVTPRKHAEEARRHAQERFEMVFEQSPIGMALLTPEGRWVRVNQAMLAITGYTSDELLAKSLEEITHPDDISSDLEYVRRLLAGEIRSYEVERRWFHARGHVISTVLSVSAMRDRSGRPQHFIAQVQDITERKLTEERLRGLAEHDALTGLHNRRLLERRLAMETARCRRDGEQAALLAFDLDGFGGVNETYGHKVGDELLKAVAVELQHRLRGTDTVARHGSDEFAVLLPGTSAEAARKVAVTLAEAIASCGVEVDGGRVSLTASVGIAAIDSDAVGGEAVLVDADRALSSAKAARGRGERAG